VVVVTITIFESDSTAIRLPFDGDSIRRRIESNHACSHRIIVSPLPNIAETWA